MMHVCVSVSLLKYRYILPMMVCLTRSHSGNDASIWSIFSALGSWSPCLSHTKAISERRLQVTSLPPSTDITRSATVSRLYSSHVWNSRLKKLLSSKLFLWPKDILSVLNFLSRSFPPSFIAGSSELAKGMCVWVVWLFPPLSRLFPLANTAVSFHCLLTASRVL